MLITTYVGAPVDLQECSGIEQVEALLEPLVLSRRGHLCIEEVLELARLLQHGGRKPVLVWDRLMTERDFEECSAWLSDTDLSLFRAVRVCDLGAVHWIREYAPKLPLQLIVEGGNHNRRGLLRWCEYFQSIGLALDRLIVSLEIPQERLADYCQTLPVGLELLGAGMIEMFYSPRKLVSPHFIESKLPIVASSPDSHNRPFPTIETANATLMYLDKDQYILDKADELKQAGLAALRIDLRHLSTAPRTAERLAEVLTRLGSPDKEWPRPSHSPFFRRNLTTKQFSRLKPPIHEARDERLLGKVLSAVKGSFTAIHTLEPFSKQGPFRMVYTDGSERAVENLNLRNPDGLAVESAEPDQILLFQHIRGAVPGCLLCR